MQRAAAERYKGEVAWLEALLTEKDLALNQTQADLATAQSEVACWHRSSAENEKRAEGRSCVFCHGPLRAWIAFSNFSFLSYFSTESERKMAEAASVAEAL